MAQQGPAAKAAPSGPSFWGVAGASAGDEMRAKLEARRRKLDEAEAAAAAEAPVAEVPAAAAASAGAGEASVAQPGSPSKTSAQPRKSSEDWLDDVFAGLESPTKSTPATAAAAAGPAPQQASGDVAGLVDDLFAEFNTPTATPALPTDAVSGTTPASPPKSQETGQTAQMFGLSNDSPTAAGATAIDDKGAAAGVPAGNAEKDRGASEDAIEDWYMLRDEDAHEILARTAQSGGGAGSSKAQGEETSEGSKSSKAASLWSSASAFGKKASKLGSKARKAIVEEAKNVAEDVRELKDGVREGYQLTAQDTKKLSERLKTEATKHRGWLGALGGGKSSRADPEGTEEPGAASASPSPSPPPEAAEDACHDGASEATCSTAAASSDASAAPGAQAEKGQPDPQDAGGQGGSEDAGGHHTAGSDALRAIKQGLAATADVSKDLWRDVREANQDAVKDLRQGVSDIRHAFKELTAAGAAAGGGQAEDAAEGGEHAAAADPSALATSPSEALDASPSARGFDEQAAKATERVHAVAQATAQASKDLWRKTEKLRQNLLVLGHQQPAQASQDDFWELPSVRANYVELNVAALEAEASARQAGTEAASAEDTAAAVLASAPATAAAVQRRVRKLGGKLAKQTQKVSAGLVEKAKDLGQNIQARSAAGAQGETAGEGGAAGGAASDGDSIFEIGSGDEEGLSDPEGETSEADDTTFQQQLQQHSAQQQPAKTEEHGILEL